MTGRHFHSEVYKKDLVYKKGSRIKKAKKILAILKHASKTSLKNLKVLDVGCAQGLISYYLLPYFKEVVGADIDAIAIKSAQKITKRGLTFKLIHPDGTFPFGNQSFDVIIANQIYEHVDDTNVLMKEIKRVMKADGFCFMGAGNRLVIKDVHYANLPFVSWLPIWIANFYVRLTKSGDYYEPRLKTILGIKKMIKDFSITDYTFNIIKNPKSFSADDVIKPNSILSQLPVFVLKFFYPIIPNYLLILRKKHKDTLK